MSENKSLKETLKKVPGLVPAVRWLGLASPSDWIFQRRVVKGVCEPEIRTQLPLVYGFFAAYCMLYTKLVGSRRIYGAKLVFSIVSSLQRLIAKSDAARIEIADWTVTLDLHDPRFIEVVNEISRKPHADTTVLASLLEAGDTFVDIGANHGSYAIVASQLVGPGGRVIAIEPQPRLASNLEDSLRNNAEGSYEVHRLALSDRTGTIDLLVPQSYSGSAGVYEEHSGLHRHRVMTVPMSRLDDVIEPQSLTSRLVVKLDIEGSEYACLKGAHNLLRTYQPKLIMEVNPNPLEAAGTDLDDLVDLLIGLGYTSYCDASRPGNWHALDSLRVTQHRNVIMSAGAPGA